MRVRPLVTGDDAEIRRIFRSTLALGDSLPFAIPDLDAYESLCLDWYLGPGRAGAAVAEDDAGAVVGYALVCTNPARYGAWTRRQAVRFAATLAAGFARRRYRGAAARFYLLRVRDAWALRGSVTPRTGGPSRASTSAHAHINIVPSHRGTHVGRMLADHVDRRVRAAGLQGWHGEINALAGQRAAALERLGGKVVRRSPNHTMTAMLGRPVERLTVVRILPTTEERRDAPIDAA
jgi:GNAT superfamily N-acetyltransferase